MNLFHHLFTESSQHEERKNRTRKLPSDALKWNHSVRHNQVIQPSLFVRKSGKLLKVLQAVHQFYTEQREDLSQISECTKL